MTARLLPLAAVLLLASCVASPVPPAYTEARVFASCWVPIVGDVPVSDAHGTRSAFAEMGRMSGFRFADASYADAARQGITVRYGGPSAVPRDVTTPTIRSGRITWTVTFYGTPSRTLVLHALGHVMGLAHTELRGNIMAVPTYPSATWHPTQRRQVRHLGEMGGCW